MKRLGSTDSLGGLLSICPSTENSPSNNHVYSREFQSMLEGLDEEPCVDESSQKKRRLSVDKVKALEKNFQVENKLEPDRKVKLAHELGLQPRQVAVWFQNRRARWKTKQLERDYGLLKANYDALKHNYDKIQQDNEALLKEISDIKSKLNDEDAVPVKEETIASENDLLPVIAPTICDEDNNGGLITQSTFLPDLKVDGSSDSDSSAILNGASSSSTTSSPLCLKFTEGKTILEDAKRAYLQPQYVKMEEFNFFAGDEACNFFSDEQAPSLQWYCHDQWN